MRYFEENREDRNSSVPLLRRLEKKTLFEQFFFFLYCNYDYFAHTEIKVNDDGVRYLLLLLMLFLLLLLLLLLQCI